MLDIRDLMNLKEAYAEVYAPKELTEEQVWEEVETWVNSLIEEGYDLSDYTWEEMYESYLEEAPMTAPAKGEVVNLPKVKGAIAGGDVTLNRGYASTLGGQKGEVTYQKKDNVVTRRFRPTGMSDIRGSDKPGSNTPKLIPPTKPDTPTVTPTATAAPKSAASGPVLSKLKGVEGTGVGANFKAKAFTDTEKTRYSSVAARTPARPAAAATAAPRPAATAAAASKPATGMLGKTSFERRTPTSAELKAAQAARAGGEKDPEKVLQAAKASSAPATGNTLSQTTAAALAPAAFSPTPAVTPAAKPTPTSKPTPAATGSKKPGSIVSSFDYFDVVKGYLIDEGYADTEEAALAIMINMSEEWRQSIVEGGFNSSGRYDVGGGRTVGPVAGAVRSLFGGNLPKGQTYVPPSPQNGTNRPPAVPSSKGDSGKLTDFGAGGGKAKLKTGMSVGQVERQGRRNKGDYSG